MKPNALEIGKPFPLAPSYEHDAQARKFWRLSFKVPRLYCDGLDAGGQPIIVVHEREEAASYSRRKRITKAWNYAGPILRKYNDFVFRVPPTRDEDAGEAVDQVVDDADGRGTTLTTFMRRNLLQAQIEREAYILPARTGPDTVGQVITKKQAEEAGIRPYLRTIDADDVFWWEDVGGVLDSAAVAMTNPEGLAVVRIFERTTYCDVMVDQNTTRNQSGPNTWTVAAIGPDIAHGYQALPLVRNRPLFDDAGCQVPTESQCAPIAEQQQAIANYLALLNEEIYSTTFTQMIAMGVSAKEVGETKVGSNRILCIPNPQGKIETLGADVAQADSIRRQISECRGEIYRASGLSPGNPTEVGAPESGVARAFRFNDLSANLSALADSVEQAENQVLSLIAGAYGEEAPAPTNYPADFDSPDYSAELDTMLKAIAPASVPATIKRAAVARFVARNLKLDDDQTAALKDESDAIGSLMSGAGGGAFPPGIEGVPTGKGKPPAAAPAPADVKVQDTALTGIQISAMTDTLSKVTQKQMSAETAKLLLQAAFPAIEPASIARMVDSAAKFNPADPAPTPPFKGQAGA